MPERLEEACARPKRSRRLQIPARAAFQSLGDKSMIIREQDAGFSHSYLQSAAEGGVKTPVRLNIGSYTKHISTTLDKKPRSIASESAWDAFGHSREEIHPFSGGCEIAWHREVVQ